MKLTKAQMQTLQHVAQGKVEYYEPMRINREGYIRGARKSVLERLVNAGLVMLPLLPKPGTHTKYLLTDVGHEALEVSQGPGEW